VHRLCADRRVCARTNKTTVSRGLGGRPPGSQPASRAAAGECKVVAGVARRPRRARASHPHVGRQPPKLPRARPQRVRDRQLLRREHVAHGLAPAHSDVDRGSRVLRQRAACRARHHNGCDEEVLIVLVGVVLVRVARHRGMGRPGRPTLRHRRHAGRGEPAARAIIDEAGCTPAGHAPAGTAAAPASSQRRRLALFDQSSSATSTSSYSRTRNR
jgi:hypothetical protein